VHVVAEESPANAAIELLPPTGPLRLGRISFHWVEATGVQPGAVPGTKCELMAHVWYPAQVDNRAPEPYIPGFATLQAALGEANLRDAAGNSYDALSSARTHVIADAPIDANSAKYPVLLLSHGLRYSSLGYSMLAEDLASHGYIVVGVDHPATALAVVFPDRRATRFSEELWTQRRTPDESRAFESRNVERCAADLVFVLNQLGRLESGAIASRFRRRLDLAHVGVLGHSFGGRVAARTCQLDKRLKAGLIIDGFGRTMTVDKNPDGSTIDQPMMVQYARRVPRSGIPRLLAQLQTPGKDLEEELRRVRKEFCESVRGGSYEVTLSTPGIAHESFSDILLLQRGQTEDAVKNHRKAMEITRGYTRAFFDRHVRDLPALLLDKNLDDSKDVELTRHTFRGQ
jgi:pimeloyl-ACP methyl ester carboxylesterase